MKIVFKNSSVNTFSIFLKYVFEVFSLHLLFLSCHSLCILEDDHEDPSTSPLSSLSIWKYISHQRWTSGDILKIFSFTLHMCEQNSPDTSFIFGSIPFPRQHPSLHIQNYTSHQLYYYFILCFSSFLSSTSFKFRCLCVWLSRIINKGKKINDVKFLMFGFIRKKIKYLFNLKNKLNEFKEHIKIIYYF